MDHNTPTIVTVGRISAGRLLVMQYQLLFMMMRLGGARVYFESVHEDRDGTVTWVGVEVRGPKRLTDEFMAVVNDRYGYTT